MKKEPRRFNGIKIKDKEHFNECYDKIQEYLGSARHLYWEYFQTGDGVCLCFEVDSKYLTYLTERDLNLTWVNNKATNGGDGDPCFVCDYFDDIDSMIYYYKILDDCKSLGVL